MSMTNGLKPVTQREYLFWEVVKMTTSVKKDTTTVETNVTLDQRIDQLFHVAELEVEQWNAAIEVDSYSLIFECKEKLNITLETLNTLRRKQAYIRFAASLNPMLAALTDGFISINKTSKVKGEEAYELVETDDLVNLKEFAKACKGKIANNQYWYYGLECFSFLMAARANDDIGGDSVKFLSKYKISKKAKREGLAETPTSMAQMIKELQKVIDGIIFEDNGKGVNKYKVISKDVNRILLVMCKDGNGLEVRLPRVDTMLRLVTKAAHRIVTNGEYPAEI